MSRPISGPSAGARARAAVRLSSADLVASRLPEGAGPPLILEPRVPGVDLVAWAADRREHLAAELDRHGAILFRGFDLKGLAGFAELVRATSSAPLAYRERSSPRETLEGEVYTSTSHPAEQEIFLHCEQSYNLTFPARIQFYCVTPAAAGGATPIASTRHILAGIPADLVERFARVGYRYVRNFGGPGLSWQAAFQSDDRRAVERYAAANQIELTWRGDDGLRTVQHRPCLARHPRTGETVWFNHATFFHVSTLGPETAAALRAALPDDELPNNTFYGDGAEIEADALEALRAAHRAARVAVPWQRGDCLMLDNMLTAHGRESFRGERLIATAMSDPRSWADVALPDGPAMAASAATGPGGR